MLEYLVFAMASTCYAFYSWCQIRIRGKIAIKLKTIPFDLTETLRITTNNYGWDWHLSQWMSVLLFVGSGVVFHIIGINFHNFGNIFLVMLFFYIIPLRLFQKYL